MSDLSIWEHVAAHVPDEGPGLEREGLVLPDDGDALNEWARGEPGAADAVRLWRGGIEPHEQTAGEVTRLLAAAAGRTSRRYPEFYERVRASDVLGYLEPFLGLVPGLGLRDDRLYDLGRLLVTTSPHRAPVKLGIALFGFFEAGVHLDVLFTLARHDEFTWYVADALGRGLDEPEPAVCRAAGQATGWGRVAAVRHLARTAGRPDTRAWLLRQGFRNRVGEEYLALPAARAGGLAAALAAPTVDDDLLDGAVDIMRALLRPGAPETMDDYEDGARVTTFVVNLLCTRAVTLGHLLAVRDIDAFVTGAADWERRAEREWTADLRDVVHGRCAEIMSRAWWRERVEAGLASREPAEFGRAAEAARLVGVDAVGALLDRLRSQPFDAGTWRSLFEQVDAARIDEAVRLAADRLPLGAIARGPGGEVMSGRRRAAYECLDVVLSGLAAWPNRGWPVVRAGLASPMVRNRNLALRALHRWDHPAWPDDAERVLHKVAEREPEPEVRRRIERLLAGQPLEQPLPAPHRRW